MLNKYPPIVKLINSFMNVLTNLLWCIHTGLVREPGLGPGQGLGRMGCMVLIRTFHTAPEQGQEEHLDHFRDLKNGFGTHFSGPENVPCDEY